MPALLPCLRAILQASGSFAGEVRLAEAPESVQVVAGPVLLHAAIEPQFGGHTFSYLVEGERGIFWSALAAPTGPVLIGQSPRPGSALPPRVTRLAFDEHAPTRVDPPLLLRTPDGTLHVFVGLARGADGHGDVRYWTSARPEDIAAFVERSERIPRTRFASFHHNRKNVGLDPKGERAVLFVLSDFVPERHAMNTPLLFLGGVEDGAFRFEEPLVLGPPAPFFYPQVAATDEGPVLLGAVQGETGRHAELVHVGWDGVELFRETLPFPPGAAETWAFELEPVDPLDWSVLWIVRAIVPEPGDVRWIELWRYDTRARELTRLRSIENDVRRELSITNAGQLWSAAGAAPLFLNEPGSSAVWAWEGDLAGSPPVRLAPLAGTHATELGFAGIRSLFLASVLQGSLEVGGRRALALDLDLAAPGTSARCAWLLWWLERSAGPSGVRFAIDSDFGAESAWVAEYLERCAQALVRMLAAAEVAPPAAIRVELRRVPDSPGIAGWASGGDGAIGFESAVWPRDRYRLWILAHELTNLLVAHCAGAGGFPSDWWSNGRSPFPEYAACLVMQAAGEEEAARERRAENAGQPDHDLYWRLDERHGFALFARFFALLHTDGIDLGEIAPPWPLPSARRSLYTAAYLSLAAGENLASELRAAGIGREPPGWSEAHPDWPFTPYTIEDRAVEELLARRRALFESLPADSPELAAARASFRRGE